MALNYTTNTDFNSDGEFSECEIDVSWASLQVKKLLELSGSSSITIGSRDFTITTNDTFLEAVKAMVALNVSASIASDGCAVASSLPVGVSLPPEELAKLPYFREPTLALSGQTLSTSRQLDYSGNNRHLDMSGATWDKQINYVVDGEPCFMANRTSGEKGIPLGESSDLLGDKSFTVKFTCQGSLTNRYTSKFITNTTDEHGFEVIWHGRDSKFLLTTQHVNGGVSFKTLGEAPTFDINDWVTIALSYDHTSFTFSLYFQQGNTNTFVGSYALKSNIDKIGNSSTLKILGSRDKGIGKLRNLMTWKESFSVDEIKWMNDTGNRLNPIYFFPCDESHTSYGDSKVSDNDHKLISQNDRGHEVEATFNGWGNSTHATEKDGEKCIMLLKKDSSANHKLIIQDSAIDWGESWLFSMKFYATNNTVVFSKRSAESSGFKISIMNNFAYLSIYGLETRGFTCSFNQWNHIVIQKNEKYLGVYLNGTLVYQQKSYNHSPGQKYSNYDADGSHSGWKSENMELGSAGKVYVKEIALFSIPYGHYPSSKFSANLYGFSPSDYLGKPNIPQIDDLSTGSFWTSSS